MSLTAKSPSIFRVGGTADRLKDVFQCASGASVARGGFDLVATVIDRQTEKVYAC